MTSAEIACRNSLITDFETALTNLGYTSVSERVGINPVRRSLPYVDITVSTENRDELASTKAEDVPETRITARIFASSTTAALAIANAVIALHAVTKSSFTDGTNTFMSDRPYLELKTNGTVRRSDSHTDYSYILRFRYNTESV